MRKVLVDTNVVSYITKKDSRSRFYQAQLSKFDSHLISFQTHAELMRWPLMKNWGEEKKRLLDLEIAEYEVIHSCVEINSFWASVMTNRQRQGIQISPQDAWIAATALYLEVPLLTHNAKDFEAIAGIQLLATP